MSEKRILIASLLKPVNDTRMYEKIGLSLAKLQQAQVHICGFQAPLPTDAPGNVVFHPVFNFKRLSLGRVTAQLKYLKLLFQVKPQLIICSTHEFLIVSSLYSFYNRCLIIYDVQENYMLNLKAQHHYSTLAKHSIATLLRTIEKVTAPAIAHFLLAEKSYAQELPFIDNRYTILENKYKKEELVPVTTPVKVTTRKLRLLYSGTIAAIYGVFEAITLADALYKLRPDTHLTIIGFCPQESVLKKVKAIIQNKPYITLIGGDKLVPHQQIIDEVKKSNLGLLPYQPNKSTFRCIPTKLYEYAALGLPMLAQNNPLWLTLLQQYKAGFTINFKKVDPQALLQKLQQQEFYPVGVPSDVFWETEEQKLLQVISSLLSKV